MWDYDWYEEEEQARPPDPAQKRALEVVRIFFRDHKESVFFSRQVEVQHEDQFFHWVTNRAIRDLIEEGEVNTETRKMSTGGHIKLLWHRSYRYYKRAATDVVRLVEEYSAPHIGKAIGRHGEQMVFMGFARNQFVLHGENVREFRERQWTETEHDLDFIVERDNVAYGVEVKNMLGYMDYRELRTKVRLCQALNIHPVFAVRMAPKHWIHEVYQAGGFVLVMKYQLYPWTHADLAKRVADTFGLPVDAPISLREVTVRRFLNHCHAKYT